MSRYGGVPKFLERSALQSDGENCDNVDHGHREHDKVDQIRPFFAVWDSQDKQQDRKLGQIDAGNIVNLIGSSPLDDIWDLYQRICEVVGMRPSSIVDAEAFEHCTSNRERLEGNTLVGWSHSVRPAFLP